MKFKKVLSGLIVFSMLSTISGVNLASAVEIETKDTPQASADDYAETLKNRLCDNIEDGVILHAWCWSFKTIKDNLEEIAKAGYTAVQTSPANACAGGSYVDANGKMKIMGSDETNGTNGAWWWHYQPIDWTVGNYQLGSKQDYKDMCEAADTYGIKIITDVLPNHTAADKSLVSQDFINAVSSNGDINDLYHDESLRFGNISNYGSRRQSTLRDMGGLPDVNTENPDFQVYFLKYCNELIDYGCDGFRLDTAKHIGVSSDPIDPKNTGGVNDFWDVATGQKSVTNRNNETVSLKNKDSLFLYGEILQGDDIPYTEYAKYMRMTADQYGYDIRNAINNNNFKVDSYIKKDSYSHTLSKDRLITWVESHDTYCNEHISADLNSEQIKLAWAAIAARKEGTPLFFNRPAGSNGKSNLWGTNEIGLAGNGEWKITEVAEVNKFRNAMVGENESLSNINDNSQVLKIDRGDKGSCIINVSESACEFVNADTTLANGTYTDRVNGTSKFTVTSGKLSGTVGARSVAVIYNTTNLKASPETAEFSDTIDVTLYSEEIKFGTNTNYVVTVGNETKASGNFSNGDKITIGKDISSSGEITLTLTATDKNNITTTKIYKYIKYRDEDAKYIYFDNNGYNWSTVSAYVYVDGNTFNATFPGEPMTYDSNIGCFKYKVPYNLRNGKVQFYSTDSNRYPPKDTSGLQINNTDKILKYGNSWINYSSSDQPDVSKTIEPDTYIYFFDSMGWSDYSINAYMWKGSGSSVVKNAEWPGEMMSWSDDLHCYYYAYNSSDCFENIIFNGKKKKDSTVYKSQTDTLPVNAGQVYVPTNETADDNKSTYTYTGIYIKPDQIQSHKVYYDNSASKWNTVNVYTWGSSTASEQKNAVWPGERATYVGNNIYSYTCYYPKTSNIENFTNIIFKDESVQTNDLTIPTDKKNPIYKYNSSNESKQQGTWLDVDSKKDSIPINFYYTDHRVAETKSSGAETYEEQSCVTTVNANTKNVNLDFAISSALLTIKDCNLYDTYTCHVSQFDYVKSLASASDSRLGSSTQTYGAVYHPSILAHSSNVCSGVYNDSIGTLDATVLNNPKWVTYYDSSNNEVAYENILPDLSNIDRVDIRALSEPKKQVVTFYYPKASTELTAFADGNLLVAKDNSDSNNSVKEVSYGCNYNQTLSDKVEDFANLISDMYIPKVNDVQYVFDGWYMIEFNSDNTVKSYVKVSSEKDYKYRLTSTLKLYAVFANSVSTQKGATALANDVDKYTAIIENTEVPVYRFNTMLNVYNCSDYDETNNTNITDVAVIYVKLGSSDTYNLETVRNELITKVSNDTGNVTINNGTASFNSYRYTVGSGKQVQLTAKNRLQFILTLKETQATKDANNNPGTYSNVLAFTAFKYKNSKWIISDNCVNYKNGEPTIVSIENNN